MTAPYDFAPGCGDRLKAKLAERKAKFIATQPLDDICEEFGYAIAKAEADRRNVVWFASAGAKRRSDAYER